VANFFLGQSIGKVCGRFVGVKVGGDLSVMGVRVGAETFFWVNR